MNKIDWSRRQILGALGICGAAIVAKKQAIGKVGASFSHSLIADNVMEMAANGQLKEGEFVLVMGYYQAGDGGHGIYRIVRSPGDSDAMVGAVKLSNGLIAKLINVETVNYAMFGAKGDGINDDSVQIKQAHDYANIHRLPVVELSGEYWLNASNTIEICTNVQWGRTIFHVNEQNNTENKPRFLVKSYDKPRGISWSEETKDTFLKALRSGAMQFPELVPFKNSLIVVRDDNDRIGYRAGADYNGQSWAKEDFFYVEEHGRILGEIAWEFKNYTHLIAYPAEDSYLTIDGGTFYLSGESSGRNENKYWHTGFSITRSRTVLQNQWVGIEIGNMDTALNPRIGFYNFSNVFDVTLSNIRLVPWEQDREGEEFDVPAGTYGISGNRVLRSYFKNVIAEGGRVHWGVFGTNLMKDLYIERCMLNRVDVHFHAWNVYIKDSKIGHRGISITGGGQLVIENTESCSRFFVNFRRDFGAKWDGNIRISNCRFVPERGQMQALLYFNPMDFDYGYPIGLAHSILVENLHIERQYEGFEASTCWLLHAPLFGMTKNGHRLFFPDRLIVKNVRITGQKSGVRLMQLQGFGGFYVRDKKPMDNTPNSLLIFEDIDLDDGDAVGTDGVINHLSFMDQNEQLLEDGLSTELFVARCNGIMGYFSRVRTDIDIKHSVIRQLICPSVLLGKITFWDCTFEPIAHYSESVTFFSLEALNGTSFINCSIHAPLMDGQPSLDHMSLMGFIVLNNYIKYNHLNTRLDRRIIKLLEQKKTKLTSNFIQKLKHNYDFL